MFKTRSLHGNYSQAIIQYAQRWKNIKEAWAVKMTELAEMSKLNKLIRDRTINTLKKKKTGSPSLTFFAENG